MTVCIAAICNNLVFAGKLPQIVCCIDWRASSVLGSADTHFKLRPLTKGWYCLSAGNESDIIGLYSAMMKQFRAAEQIDETNITYIIRHAIQQRKHEKAGEYTAGKYGLSYDDFIKLGKDRLPQENFRDSITNIGSISLKAEMLIAGFAGNEPIICKTSSDGVVSIREGFAVVGEGEVLATSVLLHREHSDLSTLDRALYCVYEANKYAERIPSVGQTTSMCVITRDSLKGIKTEVTAWLDEQFKKFGPQEIPQNLEYAGDHYLSVRGGGLGASAT